MIGSRTAAVGDTYGASPSTPYMQPVKAGGGMAMSGTSSPVMSRFGNPPVMGGSSMPVAVGPGDAGGAQGMDLVSTILRAFRPPAADVEGLDAAQAGGDGGQWTLRAPPVVVTDSQRFGTAEDQFRNALKTAYGNVRTRWQ